jgi:protein-S-isoprenylcysteine O-methyltransferase Ste14
MERTDQSAVGRAALAILSYAFVIAGVLLSDVLLDWPHIDGLGWQVAGAILLVVGAVLVVHGSMALANLYSLRGPMTGVAPSLLMSGIYGRLRHPQALGVFLALVGVALLAGSVMLLASAVLSFILTVFLTIPREERELHDLHDENFERYRAQVPAWFPRSEPYQQAPLLAKDGPTG